MRASNQFADVTTGVVYVHASPAAVCPHVEWALAATLATAVAKPNLKWTPQPAMPGQLRAVTNWVGPVGTGAVATSVNGHAVRGPVVEALVGLGFAAKQAEEAIDKVMANEPEASTASALRAALSMLGKK